jgi:hypothetical protein
MVASPADGRADTFVRGEAVAAILAGSWRIGIPAPRLAPAALEAVTPLLARGGAGGLAWHRLRQMTLRTSPAGRELRQHYRRQTLQATEREEAIRARPAPFR